MQYLGINDVFNFLKADFSAISKINKLYINKVIRKTVLDMNENGIIASAVTIIEMIETAIKNKPTKPKPILFRADDNNILFMGIY